MVRAFRQTLLLWLCCSFLLLLSLFSVPPSFGYYLANRHELGVDGNDVAFFGHLVWRERHKGEGSVFPPVVLLERVRREEDLLRDGALCVVISRETERREKERERETRCAKETRRKAAYLYWLRGHVLVEIDSSIVQHTRNFPIAAVRWVSSRANGHRHRGTHRQRGFSTVEEPQPRTGLARGRAHVKLATSRRVVGCMRKSLKRYQPGRLAGLKADGGDGR